MTLRQIPLETVFNSNDANSWRDPIIKNRIHFRFPDTWTNNVNKDAIIGIRDMFITKGYRKFELKFGFAMRKTTKTYFGEGDTPTTLISTEEDYSTQELTPITKFFGDETLFKHMYDKFKEVIDNYNKPITENNTTYNNLLCKYLINVSDFTEAQEEFINNFAYLESEYGYNIHESYFKIHCPYNDLPETNRTIETIQTGQTYQGFNGTKWIRKIYDIVIIISGMNDDAKNILNIPASVNIALMEPKLLFKNIWDRDSCILYSSLSYMSNNSYLGHTRRYALPKIKYYELTSSNKSFWVDLFATRDHSAPVILPADNKDELYIEAQLLTSQSAVI